MAGNTPDTLTRNMDVYLVGGAVRDALLDRPTADRDWVVVGQTVDAMLALGFTQVGRDFPVFLHPQTHEEYALARTERKAGPGHQGFVCHAGEDVTLEQDLERRDLTINAIAMAPDGSLVDPFHGQDDLQRQQLRHVSPAFVEDPLRVLRVARFAARLPGFEVVEETAELMRQLARQGELAQLSAERVWQELAKALVAPEPLRFLAVLAATDALDVWLAELAPAADSASRLAQAPPQLDLRFALLVASLSTAAITALCQRLKAPNSVRQLALQTVEQGKVLQAWRASEQSPTVQAPAAELLYQALASLGAFKPKGWPQSLVSVLANLDQEPVDAYQDLRAITQHVTASIKPAALMQEGHTGAALGQALARLRTDELAAWMAARSH